MANAKLVSDAKALLLKEVAEEILKNYGLEYTGTTVASSLEAVLLNLPLKDLDQLNYLLGTYLPYLKKIKDSGK